jgi:hypothetical protein
MCINEEKNKPLKLREETIEEVDEFTYLGSIIANKNGTTKDAEKRINKVRSAFGRLNKIWRSNILPVKTKLIVFKAMVKPVVLYGSQSWSVTIPSGTNYRFSSTDQY